MPGVVGRSPAAPCVLCKKEGDLQLSHLLPKFVFKHASQRSPTGYLRTTFTPNRRAQDGPKDYLLCADCEQRFSRWEASFSKIFKSNHEQPGRTFCYTEKDALAALSIVWRILAVSREHPEIINLGLDNDYSRTDEAFDVWREVLLGEREHPSDFRVHWVWFNIVRPQSGAPDGINRYIFHASDFDIWANSKQSFSVAHIPGVFLVGAMEPYERSDFRGFDVSFKGGRYIGPESKTAPSWLRLYIEQKMKTRAAAIAQMSAQQQSRIVADASKDPEKALNSSLFRAFLADQGYYES